MVKLRSVKDKSNLVTLRSEDDKSNHVLTHYRRWSTKVILSRHTTVDGEQIEMTLRKLVPDVWGCSITVCSISGSPKTALLLSFTNSLNNR